MDTVPPTVKYLKLKRAMANQTEIKSSYTVSNVLIPANKFSYFAGIKLIYMKKHLLHLKRNILIQKIQMIFGKMKIKPPLKLSATSRDTQIQIFDVECREKIYETIEEMFSKTRSFHVSLFLT